MISNIFSKTKGVLSLYYKKVTQPPYKKFNLNWFQVKYLKHADKNKEYQHKLNDRITVYFRNPPEFLLSVQELYIEEIYKFRTTSQQPKIIDCGAHIGMSILFFKLNYPNATVLAFEPDNKNFESAQKNLTAWNFEGVELLPKAVWTENGHITFQHLNDMGSNIQKTGSHQETNASTTRVECVRLKDLLQSPVDFVKLDIEGAEYEVLMDCGASIKNVENLFIEYHGNYNEMHKLTEILELVTAQGFAYYIKEAGNIYQRPFYDREKKFSYDVQLNIFCFKQ